MLDLSSASLTLHQGLQHGLMVAYNRLPFLKHAWGSQNCRVDAAWPIMTDSHMPVTSIVPQVCHGPYNMDVRIVPDCHLGAIPAGMEVNY